jgi:hypothetical protein
MLLFLIGVYQIVIDPGCPRIPDNARNSRSLTPLNRNVILASTMRDSG